MMNIFLMLDANFFLMLNIKIRSTLIVSVIAYTGVEVSVSEFDVGHWSLNH